MTNGETRENEEWWNKLFNIMNLHYKLNCSKLCRELDHPRRELTSKQIGDKLGITRVQTTRKCRLYKIAFRVIPTIVMRKNGRKMTTFENLYSFSVPNSPSVDDGVE